MSNFSLRNFSSKAKSKAWVILQVVEESIIYEFSNFSKQSLMTIKSESVAICKVKLQGGEARPSQPTRQAQDPVIMN